MKEAMTRFCKKVLLFGLFLVPCYLLVLLIAANAGKEIQTMFRRYTNIPVGVANQGESALLRFREIEAYRNVDILFVGSSHAYRSFDPRFFDRKKLYTFNMGSTLQTPLNSYFLLRQHLDRLAPKLIVFEVYWQVLQRDGLESFLDLCENLPFTPALGQMAFATRNVRAINALLVSLLELGREPIETIAPRIDKRDRYVAGGFVERNPRFEGQRTVVPHKIDVNARQVRYLEKNLQLAKDRGMAVALVVQPVPRETQDKVTNLREVQELLTAFAQEQDVVYIDFNDLMHLDDRDDFYDYHHLNQFGVEKFNVKLYEELQKHNLLPVVDHSKQARIRDSIPQFVENTK